MIQPYRQWVSQPSYCLEQHGISIFGQDGPKPSQWQGSMDEQVTGQQECYWAVALRLTDYTMVVARMPCTRVGKKFRTATTGGCTKFWQPSRNLRTTKD